MYDKVVAFKEHHMEVEIALRRSCREYLGSDFVVTFEFVENIKPEKNGKIKFVKSELN